MNIEKKTFVKQLKELNPGDCFELKDEIYLVTDGVLLPSPINNAVKLETGEIVSIDGNVCVIHLALATVVIEE